MHEAFSQVDHRPWPLPQRRWVWRQSWRDLLFAHWPIAASALRQLVPESLDIDTFEGTSWLGLVPFRMAGVMRRPWPDMPWVSAFPELNVRVYVSHKGKPGVWFLSLDATNPLAVFAARRFFHLPYYRAKMSLHKQGTSYQYTSRRMDCEFEATYEPASDVYLSKAGSLEHWLTERYCLYAQAPDSTLWCNEVHHHPWPLQKAKATIRRNTMFNQHGLSVQGEPTLLHFAKQLDVVVWPGTKVCG